jgi:hypothetical protein
MARRLSDQLILNSCPHCGRAKPTLVSAHQPKETQTYDKVNPRWWGVYSCTTCGGMILAGGPSRGDHKPYETTIQEIYPATQSIDESIPQKPREFLRQAQESLHAPAGAIMLSASALDAMLKEKDYAEGSLYERIDKAATDHLITDGMARWAHQIRLDANEQRHADKTVELPTQADAKLTFDFAMAFAEYLFVLPSRVTRGIADATAS